MDGELWIHLLFGHLNELISWTFGLIWSKHSGELVNASPIFTLLLTLFLFSTHCFFLLITCFVWLIFLDLKFFNLPSQKDKSSKVSDWKSLKNYFQIKMFWNLKKKNKGHSLFSSKQKYQWLQYGSVKAFCEKNALVRNTWGWRTKSWKKSLENISVRMIQHEEAQRSRTWN